MEKTYQKLDYIFCKTKLKRLLSYLSVVIVVLVLTVPKANALSLIEDEESEIFLQKIITPLYRAAQIPFNKDKIHIVNDNSLNAFVSDGNHLFVNSGTIVQAESANELSGVLAHETGHITGGHILRQKLKNQSLQKAGLASMIAAGTAAILTGNSDVAMAIAMGSQSSGLHHFLQYRTEQERSADESAVKLLKATKQSPQGMLAFMKRIQKQNQINGLEENPYFRTHPITQERINFFSKSVKESPYKNDGRYDKEFGRVKAKLYAYLEKPEKTFNKYPLSDKSIAAKYAQAIANFKLLNIANAIKITNELIAKEPHNPFFYELKGQILMESGQVHEAKQAYLKAWQLRPEATSIQVALAQALIEDNPQRQDWQDALKLLNRANHTSPSPINWMLAARAYEALGNSQYANYAAAEYSLAIGNIELAEKQVQKLMPTVKSNNKLKLKLQNLEQKIRNRKL